jgi:hypothetical protein
LASPATATVLGTLVVVLAAVYIPLAGLVHQLTILNVGPTVATILIYAAVGVVVARHQPRNPLGWLGGVGAALVLRPADQVGMHRAVRLQFLAAEPEPAGPQAPACTAQRDG